MRILQALAFMPVIVAVSLTACSGNGEDPGFSSEPAEVNFVATYEGEFVPDWKDGAIVSFAEVVERTDHQIVNAAISMNADGAVEGSATFSCSGGPAYSYYLIFSPGHDGSESVPLDGNREVLFGESRRFLSRQAGKSVDILMRRYTTGLDLSLEGIPEGEIIKSVTLKFPDYIKVTGNATFYPKTGKLGISGESSSVTTNPECTSHEVEFELIPFSLAANSSVRVDVITDKDVYMGKITTAVTVEFPADSRRELSVQLSSGAVFSNPVTPVDWPDPTIWEDNGRFYTIATGVGAMYSSIDLVNWTKMSVAVLSGSAVTSARNIGKNFWAPDVVKVGDKWMLYLTCYNSASDCGIVAFSSDSPSGPFQYVNLITHSKTTGIQDTIDAEVVYDDSTGKLWLFFGSVGKVHRVELSPDGTSLASDAQYVHVAGLAYSQDKSRSKVFEGSYLHRHGDYWYLFVSSGNYGDASYMIKVGRSSSLEGEFFDRKGNPMTEGNATVVLSSSNSDNFYGPGHNGEIFTDLRGQDYMFYHCHDKSSGSSSSRFTLLQRLYWDEEGWPYFEGGKPLAEDVAPKMH